MADTGILLINLGTPNDCTVKATRAYLKPFLLDPRVIDLPLLARWLLIRGIILPLRPRKSAKAYQKIWQKDGSPLLIHTQALAEKLQAELCDNYKVAFGMRYGDPSIAHALTQLKGLEKIIVLPLFPQYSSAATGSALEAFYRASLKDWNIPSIKTIHQFYQDPGFIESYARNIRQYYQPGPDKMLLLSYHGLPQRHIEKSECKAQCDKQGSCPKMNQDNAFCYRAQCYATSRAIAKALKLKEDDYRVSFQSRLGKIPWIVPYTDHILKDLRKEGIKHLCVACPSFVADCLETLEEINLELREDWQAQGGTSFSMVPCLNSDDYWVEALAKMLALD